MRNPERAPFTTVKALTTHSPKDALRSPVGTSTGCSPPRSRAVSASLPGVRKEAPPASADNRRECDSSGFASGAVPDHAVVGLGHRPPSSKTYVFDSTREYSTQQAVLFWKSPSVFSDFTPSRFEVDGVSYNSGEPFFAASKARLFGDETAVRTILRATHPNTIKQLGRQVRGFDETVWVRERENIMLTCVYYKLLQNFWPKPALSTLSGALAFAPTILKRQIPQHGGALIY